MNNSRRQFGFSLIEALLATGILGIGLVLIAMVFPVGIKLTSVAAERTVGAVAANEAFAKIQLYGLPDYAVWPPTNPTNLPHTQCTDYLTLLNLKYGWSYDYVITANQWREFLYPSVAISAGMETQRYHWSALCRGVNDTEVQATVFVTRKAAEGQLFYTSAGGSNGRWPSPVPVPVQFGGNDRELEVLPGPWGGNVYGFFSDNATFVANHDGRIYRIQEYKAVGGYIKNMLVLTESWQPPSGSSPWTIWVIPPGVGSTRNPVIGVVQKTITISP